MSSSEETAAPVDKRGERIRAMFAGIAPRYDFLNHLLSLNIDRYWRRATLRAAPPDPRSTAPILDVCTGTGDLALAYAKAAGPSVAVFGVDFCAEMLDFAKRKGSKRGHAPTFLQGDAQALPFPDDHFQLATAAFGLRNVTDVRAGILEMIRVVEPGGRVAILEFSRPRDPVLGGMYLAYFRHVLPRIGQAFAPNRESAYHYLPASVLQFPDGPELVALLTDAGLASVSREPLTLGIATIYVGRKPARTSLQPRG